MEYKPTPSPSVLLISKPIITAEGDGIVDDVWKLRPDQFKGEDSEIITEMAGRVCYDSAGKKSSRSSDEYHKHIAEVKHFSVWRHVTFVFDCKDWSRNMTHELIRHHVGTGISQESHRYVDVSDLSIAEHPIFSNLSSSTFAMMREHEQSSAKLYQTIVDELVANGATRKEARGAASRVLPHGWRTSFLWSCNVEALRNIALQRISPAADAEIRQFMEMVMAEVEPYIPRIHALIMAEVRARNAATI